MLPLALILGRYWLNDYTDGSGLMSNHLVLLSHLTESRPRHYHYSQPHYLTSDAIARPDRASLSVTKTPVQLLTQTQRPIYQSILE